MPNLVIKDENGVMVGRIVYLGPYGQFAVFREGIIAVSTADGTDVSPSIAIYRGADLKSYWEVQSRWSPMFADGCGDNLTAIDTRYTGTNSGNGFRLGRGSSVTSLSCRLAGATSE